MAMAVSRVPSLQVMILDHMRVSSVAYDQLPDLIQSKVKDYLAFFNVVAKAQSTPDKLPKKSSLSMSLIEEITSLLEIKKDLKEPEFVRAVCKVGAISGSLAAAGCLVKLSNATQQDKDEILKRAAIEGFLEIAQLIVNTGGISDNTAGLALMNAAKYEHIEIVKFLLTLRIDDKYKGAAFEASVENSRYKILELLIALPEIPGQNKRKSLEYAIKTKKLKVAVFIVSSKNVSKEIKENAFIYAAQVENFEFVEAFPDIHEISDEAITKVFMIAVRSEHEQVVQFLIGKMSDSTKEKALKSAAYDGQVEVVKVLINSGGISKETKERALMNAARGARLPVVYFLIGLKDISKEAKESACLILGSKVSEQADGSKHFYFAVRDEDYLGAVEKFQGLRLKTQDRW